MANEVATRNIDKTKTIQAIFEKPAVKNQLQKAIPKSLTVERLLRVSLTAIRNNPKLLQCSQQSLLACVMGCATLGLEPEPFLGQAYLVPYWSKKKKCYEAQLIPGYRGYITLARRSGEVQSLSAQVVYENDHFNLQFGLNETLDHVPADGERGDIKGAYVIFRYKDGSYSFDYMPKKDIDAIRARSKSPDNGPWDTDYGEMAKKSVIRRHVKIAPLSVELAKTAAMENLALAGESQIDFFTSPDQEQIGPPERTVDDFYGALETHYDGDVPDGIEAFIKETAKANDTDPDTVKVLAVDQIESLADAFERWAKDANPTEKPFKEKSELEKAAAVMSGPVKQEAAGPDSSENDDEEHSCPHCEFVAKSERGLKKHITQQHGDEDEGPSGPEPPAIGEADSPFGNGKKDMAAELDAARTMLRGWRAKQTNIYRDVLQKNGYAASAKIAAMDIVAIDDLTEQIVAAYNKANGGSF